MSEDKPEQPTRESRSLWRDKVKGTPLEVPLVFAEEWIRQYGFPQDETSNLRKIIAGGKATETVITLEAVALVALADLFNSQEPKADSLRFDQETLTDDAAIRAKQITLRIQNHLNKLLVQWVGRTIGDQEVFGKVVDRALLVLSNRAEKESSDDLQQLFGHLSSGDSTRVKHPQVLSWPKENE